MTSHHDAREPTTALAGAASIAVTCLGRLKPQAMYAVGVQTAIARGALMVEPLLAALAQGRPVVLITPLRPDQAALARWLDTVELASAIDDGRLQVFTAAGDSSTNLVLRGAAGYVRELDYHGVQAGSLVVIDQADDLFTLHDHAAVVHQAEAYAEWCVRGGHTLLQLHLRSSDSHPVLDGNQAALLHFAGLAKVVAEADSLRLKVDFWDSHTGFEVGTTLPLQPLLGGHMTRLPVLEEHARLALPRRQQVWYVGRQDAQIGAVGHLIQWHWAASIAEVVRHAPPAGEMNAVIALDEANDFAALIGQVSELREALGPQARIVVRETRYRLREHLQRRWLLRAGLDAVLSPGDPIGSWAAHLIGPRPEAMATPGLSSDWTVDVVPTHDTGWLPAARFLNEAKEVLNRSRPLQVPCTLAEVVFEFDVNADLMVPEHRVARHGDLVTSTGGAQLFLLHGCGERDAVQVVTRWMTHGVQPCLRRISLFTGESAINERLAYLHVEDNPQPDDDSRTPALGHNIVAMPGASRTPPSIRTQVNAVVFAGMVLSLALLQPDEAFAQAPQLSTSGGASLPAVSLSAPAQTAHP